MVISIVNQKGGVAKTTTTLALGAFLHGKGRKVLFVDLDSQCNLTHTIGIQETGPTVLDIMDHKELAGDAVVHTEWGDVIPSTGNLAIADTHFVDFARAYHLKEALENIQDRYDYILVDTPPSLGVLTMNALTASDSLVIPAQADRYSLEGVAQLYQTIDVIRKYSNPHLKVLGILITRYTNRSILRRTVAETLGQVAEARDTHLFEARIRECVAISEAQTKGTDIFSYNKRSNATQDYQAFGKEFLSMVEEKKKK